MSEVNPQPTLDIQVLGPLSVHVGRHECTPAGRLPRTVLSVLVARLGSAVDTDALIEAVWDGSPPRSARSALRVHISRLRQAVGIDSLVTTTDHGYRLDTDPQTIDAYRFEVGVTEGRRLLRAGAHLPAAETLRMALGEWRDAPYADAQVQALEAVRLRLTTLHDEAMVDLAEAEIEILGDRPDIASIEQLVAADPLDERRWGLLMKALYRAGRQADALDAYKRAGSVLGDELGIEPGPALRDLEEQILLHDPRLQHHDSSARVKLPGFATSMVGRVEQISALAKQVSEQRLVTVTGLGGVGKTRLAVGAAHEAAPDFPDGAIFVPLDPLLEHGSAADAVAERFGVPVGPEDPIDSLAEHLEGRRLVLVLDNCEHVLEGVAALVRRLIAECPDLSMLCTSRVPLGITGENVVPLRPLTIPPPDLAAGPPAALLTFESIALFCDRARQARADFSLDTENGPVIAEIVRRLAGVPLSIEIAAAQSDVLTPGDILARLDASSTDLVAAERDRPERHRSMADAVAWSLGLLDEPAQELFARMAVFGSPVDVDTIEAVCGDDSLEPGAIRSSIASLTRASLVTVDLEAKRASYAQLPPIREVARGRLGRREGDLRDRHLARYADEAAREVALVGGPDEAESFSRITGAIDEFRSALDHALSCDRTLGARLCVDLGTYWMRTGRTREGRTWVGQFLAGDDRSDLPLTASLLHLAGSLALVEQDLEHADRALTAAMDIRRTLDAPQELGMTLSNLGSVANVRGVYPRAEEMFREALDAFTEISFDRGRAAANLNLGLTLLNLDRVEEAIASLDRAVDGFRMIGDRAEEANALLRLGYAHADRGDLARAEACRVAAHHITESLGRAPDVAWSHVNLAAHHLEAGNPDRACADAAQSARIVLDEALERWWVPDLLELAAHISAARGDPELGGRLFGCALGVRRRQDVRPPEASQGFIEATEKRLEAALGADRMLVQIEIGRSSDLEEVLGTIAAWAD